MSVGGEGMGGLAAASGRDSRAGGGGSARSRECHWLPGSPNRCVSLSLRRGTPSRGRRQLLQRFFLLGGEWEGEDPPPEAAKKLCRSPGRSAERSPEASPRRRSSVDPARACIDKGRASAWVCFQEGGKFEFRVKQLSTSCACGCQVEMK